ncbi:MAG: hypothetical protein GSR74_00190 [Desulfurococcales archaeon]|nr:hypothetical protein [Desulfurococcales archaeon]
MISPRHGDEEYAWRGVRSPGSRKPRGVGITLGDALFSLDRPLHDGGILVYSGRITMQAPYYPRPAK